VVDIVEDKKAEDITLLDLRPDVIIADFFVLANGNSERHLRAIAEDIRQEIKEKFQKIPFSIDGEASSGWIVLDYGDIVVHLFAEDQREYYDLQRLWGEQANVLLSIQ